MYRGTTPTVVIEIPNEIPVSSITVAYLSFEQNKRKVIEIPLEDMDLDTENNTLSVTLSQEQTLKFENNVMVMYQLRLGVDGAYYATNIWEVPAERIIKDGVI